MLENSNPIIENKCAADLLRPLLLEILKGLGGARETPLRFGIDGVALVDQALGSYMEGLSLEARASLPGWAGVTQTLDAIVTQALCGEDGNIVEGDVINFDHAEDGGVLVHWVEGLSVATRMVDAKAVDVLKLRVEGYSHREISERLNLGLRLVGRMISDIQIKLTNENRAIKENIQTGGAKQ